MDSARTEYFEYILEYLSGDGKDDEPSYSRLLWIMYNYEFDPIVEMDSNRVKNALYLRDHICEEVSLPIIKDDFCSVLDILVHLADRMAFNLDALGESDSGLRCYFWEMIENFGFCECSDNNRYWSDEWVLSVLKRFVERRYDNNACDTPFPNCHNVTKYYKFELWDQMQLYIEEHYK